MIVFAIARFSFWVGSVCFLTCIGLLVYSVWPSSSKPEECKPPPQWSIAFRAIGECAAIWLWLVPSFHLLAFMFLLGPDWRPSYDPIVHMISGTWAVIVSGLVAARSLWGRMTPRFLWIHLWVPVGLLLALGGVWAYEILRHVEGLSAEAAAQNVMKKYIGIKEPVRLMEDDAIQMENDPSPGCKKFWIMTEKEPIGRFAICPHKWIGWTFSGNHTYGPSKPRLEEVRARIEKGSQIGERTIRDLHSIIEDYPNTPAEEEARKMLDSIDP